MSNEHTLPTIQTEQQRAVEVANALPMRLQGLDLARHTVIAPDGKRYVVATLDDTRLGRGYMTSIYPQQNGYLTLLRLMVAEFSNVTPHEAIKLHRDVTSAIQQGHLNEFIKSA